MARSSADAEIPELVATLRLAVAIPAGAFLAGLLDAVGVAGPAPEMARLGAALALLGLVVAVNALLRLQGLGGEGLPGAIGVLGAALILMGRALAAVHGVAVGEAENQAAQGGVELLPHRRLELLAFSLAAIWVARSGWALRLLLEPSALVGWGSVAAGALAAALALEAFLRGEDGGPRPLAGGVLASLAFVPLAAWAAGLAALGARGAAPAREPAQQE